MTFEEYVALCERTYREKYPVWRRGQTYFNVLYELCGGIANAVRGSELDPFHIDGRLAKFLEWVREHWQYILWPKEEE